MMMRITVYHCLTILPFFHTCRPSVTLLQKSAVWKCLQIKVELSMRSYFISFFKYTYTRYFISKAQEHYTSFKFTFLQLKKPICALSNFFCQPGWNENWWHKHLVITKYRSYSQWTNLHSNLRNERWPHQSVNDMGAHLLMSMCKHTWRHNFAPFLSLSFFQLHTYS